MEVTLLYFTPIFIASRAIRTCWDSHIKSDEGKADLDLIYRIGNIKKHKSTLEHLNYTFYIKGMSRAALQELARHRIASMSVKSSRYTLKELKKESSFIYPIINFERASKFIVLQKMNEENQEINTFCVISLENLRILLEKGKPNDIAKYAMPECYKTELTWSINARSLQNFLELRSSKNALREIRKLAFNIFQELPKDHKYLFREFMTYDDV